jgi:hypothetical protein
VELLIGSNLLLWVAVIALAVGYFSLVSRVTSQQNVHAGPEELVGRPVPPEATALLEGLGLRGSLAAVFLTESCEPCSRLADELGSNQDQLSIPLVVVAASREITTFVSAVGGSDEVTA